MEKNTKKEKISMKKVLGAFLALALVAVVSIMGTLAFLGYTTKDTTNTFTGSNDISLEVQEPSFDNDKDSDSKNYTPGMTIPKDPLLRNTNTAVDDKDLSEWVAMRVDYATGSTKTPITYTEFTAGNKAIISTFNELDITDWKKITDGTGTYDIYIYKKRLLENASTTKLFQSVTISDNVDDNYADLPEFHIIIKGAAIKNETSLHENDAPKEALDFGKVSYTADSTTTNEYKIMDALVKLLTTDDEYHDLTGNSKSGS